ncbi:Uncharacterized protein FWK35_00032532, partial [Aphis craccivora]
WRGTEWPSVLRRQLRRTPSPVRTSVTGGTSLRTNHGVWRRETAIPHPGHGRNLRVPNRNSAN